MTASLLDICTLALDEISSIQVPTFIVGNPDDTAKQLLAFAKKVGVELVRDYDWQELDSTGAIVTAAGTPAYAVAADFDRLMSDTLWDGDNHRRVWGALSKRGWATLKNSVVTGAYFAFRYAGGNIELKPTPTGVVNMNYAYQSKYYCSNSTGTAIATWTNDSDIPRLPEDLFINGIRYYFSKANNLPYGDAEAEYDGAIQARQGKNTPSGSVDMGAGNACLGRGDNYRLNIPDRIDV